MKNVNISKLNLLVTRSILVISCIYNIVSSILYIQNSQTVQLQSDQIISDSLKIDSLKARVGFYENLRVKITVNEKYKHDWFVFARIGNQDTTVGYMFASNLKMDVDSVAYFINNVSFQKGRVDFGLRRIFIESKFNKLAINNKNKNKTKDYGPLQVNQRTLRVMGYTPLQAMSWHNSPNIYNSFFNQFLDSHEEKKWPRIYTTGKH